jgi:hypothetical protein
LGGSLICLDVAELARPAKLRIFDFRDAERF